MRMQKGLCIELNGEYSVFIGHNGEFVHGKPAGETAVGEESYFYPKQVKVKKQLAMKPIWAPIIAAVAVAVLFLSVLMPRQEAFAYVQVQVNPGIELGIDEEYKVISIRELNPDGLELIGQLGEWKHHSLEEVLDEVIVQSVKGTTKEIVITTVVDEEDELTDKAIVESVEAISAKILTGNVTVWFKEASKKQWRTSVEESIPVGQLVSNSKNLINKPAKESQTEDQMKYPLKIQEKKLSADKQAVKKLKADEKLEKKEEKEAEKIEDKKVDVPVTKEKAIPQGQEKRKETHAAEKGNPNPPGQEKRNGKIDQDKKSKASQTHAPTVDKEKANVPKKQEAKSPNIQKETGKNFSKAVNGAKEQNKNGNKENNNNSIDSKTKDKEK